MLPIWVYVVVAAGIAAAGFAIGQAFPGMGTVFVAPAASLWVAYSVYRQRRFRRDGCRSHART